MDDIELLKLLREKELRDKGLEIEPISPEPLDYEPINEEVAQPTPSLFSQVSKKYQEKTPELSTQSIKKSLIAAPTKQPSELDQLSDKSAQNAELLDVYGSELNDQAIKQAQEEAKKQRLLGGLFSAGSRIAQGINKGAGGSGAFVDTGQSLKEEADIPLKNILQRREAKDKELRRQGELETRASESEKKDVASPISKAYRDFAKTLGFSVPETVSAYQLEKIIPTYEKAFYAKESTKDKEQSRLERKAELEDKALAKKEEKAKLSDKQLEQVDQFDQSIEKMQSALDALGDNASWTGPVDGNIPDFLTPSDQVAFRSAVGRMTDAYRHLITGAGAGNKELEKLESRLPSATDTFANFQAKAKDFIKEVQNSKNKKLENFQKQGKNVSAFKTETPKVESDLIKVKDSSGTIHTIKRTNLEVAKERAKKQGQKLEVVE